jgi:nitrite reductase (cytochrome c-552)
MRDKRKLLMVTGIVIVFLVVLVAGVFYFQNRDIAEGPDLPAIGANETDPAVWGKHYPRHYDSYQKNLLVDTVDDYSEYGKYGGAFEKESHLERYPYMENLYAGYGFSVEYNEERGHLYTLEDIRSITPVRTKTGAVCNICKSAQIPSLIEKYGEDFYLMGFEEINDQLTHPIACLDCHDPETMELRISRPALVEALEAQGKDVENATQQEMRSLVCAQCHVEYYMQPETKKLTFPWDKGLKPDEVLDYYNDLDFSDWIHPDSETSLLKAQHPDYEFFVDSTHYAAGVSCADCHMPYVKEGNVKITSHWWTSPLKNMEQSCLVCHRDSAEELKERVFYTQDRTYEMKNLAGTTIEKAIDEIAKSAGSPEVDEKILDEARTLHRQAQWYWDWMAAENSMGFHNPQEGLFILGKSVDCAHQAIEKAQEARTTER